MPRLSLFAASSFIFLLAQGIEAAAPREASEPAPQSVEKPQPDTAGNPEFRSAGTRYPGKTVFNAYGCMLLGTVIPLAAATAIPVDGTSGDASAVVKSSLFLGGLLIGPSAGQFYAGSYGRGALAVAFRTAGFAAGLHGLSTTSFFCEGCEEVPNAGVWIVGGFVVYVGGVVYSMYDQEKGVERYNGKLRGDGAFGWSPTLIPGAGGSLRTGATAWMRF